MLLAQTDIEVHNARAAIARVGKLADGIINFGPFGVGLDGMLTWIPVVGFIYSLGAGAMLLGAGVRARAPIPVLLAVLAIIFARSGIGEVPLIGQIAVDLFRGHRWAANLLCKAIDETLYVEGGSNPSDPAYAAVQARVRSGDERRRVVFLGARAAPSGWIADPRFR